MELFKQYASGKEKPKLEMLDRDIEKVKQSPYTKTRWRFSKDMKYIIHETVITDIKPLTYLEKISKRGESK